MQVRRSIPFLTSLACIFVASGAYFLIGNGEKQYEPREGELLGEAASGYKGAVEYYKAIRQGITGKKVRQTRKAVKEFSGQKAGSLDIDWSSEGPVNQGGRTRSILIMKGDSSNMLAGGVSGGVWKSNDKGKNWRRLPAFDEEVIVSSMAQLNNGDVYVATGSVHESGNSGPNSGQGGSGFMGRGLYSSSDGGNSFQLVSGTRPDSNKTSDPWAFINDIASDPGAQNKLLIAASGGLSRYDPSNGSFTNLGVSTASSVDASSDGDHILASNTGGGVHLSTDGGSNFEELTFGVNSPLPDNTGGRAEVAVSPTDKDYMYVVFTSGGFLHSVHMTKNGGDSWHEIAGGGSGSFKPFNNGLFGQADYDNVISVKPGSPGTIVLGGVTLWKWKNTPTQFDPYAGQWSKLATNNGFPASVPFYVHADIHAFAWASASELYIGTDGGVFVSDDNLETFLPSNRGYVTTQFYSVEFSPSDQILGGTQDNGTIYLDRKGRWDYGDEVRGGDGFASEISQMDPSVLFATTYGNQPLPSDYVQRSENGGGQISNFLNSSDFNLVEGFHSNIRLFEDPNDTDSKDSVEYINTRSDSSTIYQGDTIRYKSQTLQKEVKGTLPVDSLPYGDTTLVQDPVQSLFAFTAEDQGNVSVYLTRDALRLTKSQVNAHPVRSVSYPGAVNCYAFSPDGNYLWIGTMNGSVYRVSGLDSAYNATQFQNEVTSKEVLDTNPAPSSPVSGIDVDHNDPDHVAVSFSGYDDKNKVWQTFDATSSSPSFNCIWKTSTTNLSDGLAQMPVYDVIIERDDPNVLLVGTEYGVYASDDGGNTWAPQNDDALGHTPVFDIEQQKLTWDEGAKNPGYIYLGTHGRGFFKSDDFKSIKPEDNVKAGKEDPYASFDIHPNPASERTFISFSEVSAKEMRISIYDLKGKKVSDLGSKRVQGSDPEVRLDVGDLNEGVYILRARSDDFDRTGKLVISR